MAFDAKGIIKDNGKLILSVLGIIVFSILAASNINKDMTLYSLNNTGVRKSSSNSTEYFGDAKPVNNGNSNIYSVAPEMEIDEGVDYYAEILTSKGAIEVDLFEDIAPNNVNNFVFLASDEFYDGSTFHRVIKDYIIQGGDPLGTGSGGPGYYIDDEIAPELVMKPFHVVMVNPERDANGSQFFIVTRNISDKNIEENLQGKYTIIGEVIDGFNIIDSIELARVDQNKMPYDSVLIEKIEIDTN